MKENIIYHISQSFHSRKVCINIFDDSLISHPDSPYGHVLINGVFEPVKDEMSLPEKSTIEISEMFIKGLTEALVKYCDKTGISLEKEDHLKGRMEATEKHLEHVSNILGSFIEKKRK